MGTISKAAEQHTHKAIALQRHLSTRQVLWQMQQEGAISDSDFTRYYTYEMETFADLWGELSAHYHAVKEKGKP